ncbi:MAG TPA: sugar ABC transporter permease [Haloplasmataceae bacterium]
MEKKQNWKGYLYLAPALILMTIFTFYPIFNAFYSSLKLNYNWLLNTFDGFGFDNYVQLFKSKNFRMAFRNTMILTFVSVPLSVMIALLISVGLNSIKRLQGFFQTIFFLPYVTNVIAIGLVFRLMFNYDYGIINTIIGWFGIGPVHWMDTQATYVEAMSVVIIYSIWMGLPFKIMVFLSGLQSIDRQYYQAAKIDSTPKWRVFFRITVPLLSPMIMYITITSFMGAFKAYESVLAVFPKGGTVKEPNSLKTVVWYIYDALSRTDTGAISMASAAAVVLFLFIMLFTLIQMYISKKTVYYS